MTDNCVAVLSCAREELERRGLSVELPGEKDQ